MRPLFLITIDTEGDNLWSQPRLIATENSRFLPRFQALCERFGFKPTYLTNYEMAMCPVYREFARDVLKRSTAEVGMHLHAWNSPPLSPLTADDYLHQPYLIEYPEAVIRDKVVFMTRLLEDTFQIDVTSHRAGRWSFNEVYARVLVENGYRVDCSVTPRVSWRDSFGDPSGSGGADFSNFPDLPYYMDLDNIRRSGASRLLEIPMTVLSLEPAWSSRVRRTLGPGKLPSRALRRFFPPVAWLRPNGSNRGEMRRLVDRARREGRPCVEFMLHSSEFMPGGSPTFPDDASIENLYRDVEALFTYAVQYYDGATLTEFAVRQ